MFNLILNTDSYKASHYLQYPPGTEYISCYIESRGGKFEQAVFFGLQAFLKEYLTKPITKADIDEAQDFFAKHGLPFNQPGWQHILDKHGGYLPIEIEAVPEGMIVPCSNVLVQVINTDEQSFWLPTYIETALLRGVWYPTTVATTSWYCRKTIAQYLLETTGSLDGLEFKLHDFGARGASSFESAKLGGMAHLLCFESSDTISGILGAREYYGAKMAGFSIPAAEHSTIVSWGQQNESQSYAHIMNAFKSNNVVSIVSDSYDLWHALDEIWGNELHDALRQFKGTIVIRPDSGEPVSVVTKTIEKLMLKFGHTVNSRGYKVLPPFVRVIQGDGISPDSVKNILERMRELGQSAENITFGMGASLLQKCNRDTMRFAMKTSSIRVNGAWLDVAKISRQDPRKQSKAGRLALVQEGQNFSTMHINDLGTRKNLLKPVYRNGKLLVENSFQEIRDRVNMYNSHNI
jgi:nicotinamide phosphoribosyltransferase